MSIWAYFFIFVTTKLTLGGKLQQLVPFECLYQARNKLIFHSFYVFEILSFDNAHPVCNFLGIWYFCYFRFNPHLMVHIPLNRFILKLCIHYMMMLYKSETINTHIYCMLNNMNCPTFTNKNEPPIYLSRNIR